MVHSFVADVGNNGRCSWTPLPGAKSVALDWFVPRDDEPQFFSLFVSARSSRTKLCISLDVSPSPFPWRHRKKAVISWITEEAKTR
jgi:hypothetical protein